MKLSRRRRREPPGDLDLTEARRVVRHEVESQAAGLLERLIFLSDGVFAIAMTLLVVELTVPEISSGFTADLAQQLWALGPRYQSYAISFLVIAWYWTRHQHIFSYIVRADGLLVWLNVLLLLCIAFQPFPTSVLGSYATTAAVTFFAGTLFVTGMILLALWVYATRGHHLVSPKLSGRVIEHHTWRAASAPLVFLASIGIAQVNPTAAEFSWLAIALLVVVLRRVYRETT